MSTYLFLPLLALPFLVQDAVAPKPAPEPRKLEAADYGRFESLGFGSRLAPDGRWLAYSVSRVDKESELRLKMLATESHVTIEYGRGAAFSKDSRWVGYLIGV